MFTGLAYAEFAARVPISGSAYTYAYTSFGELLAWIIGWDLTLEYCISAAAIARAWGDYFVKFLQVFNVDAPQWLNSIPLGGTQCSILAASIVILCVIVMATGVRKSSFFNIGMTAVNLIVLLVTIIAGSTVVNSKNWTVENNSYVPYGVSSVFAGAGKVFFSYLGFDMVSSLASETKKPQRDLPIGIIGSLIIAMLVYIFVTLVVTGMLPFTEFIEQAAPIAYVFQEKQMNWAAKIISIGALFGLTTATFTCLWGQPRIFLSMARDGLLFKFFARVWPKTQIPLIGTIITGVFTALIAFFVTLDALADAISIGTLLSFSIVNSGVIVVRYSTDQQSKKIIAMIITYIVVAFFFAISFTYKLHISVTIISSIILAIIIALIWRQKSENIPTTFKCPLVPLLPCAAILINAVMIVGLDYISFLRFLIWLVLGLLIYFSYGIHNSNLYVTDATNSN